MSTKKIALTIVAVVLICALSVAGTLAYLTKNSNEVVNTFVSAGDLLNGELMLKERQVFTNEDGTYDVKDTTTHANYLTHQDWVEGIEYAVVLPGLTLPKQATVLAQDINVNAPAYLYMEVKNEATDITVLVDGIAEPLLTWDTTTDTNANWIPLLDNNGVQVTGAQGGKVWVYTNGTTAAALVKDTDGGDDADLYVDFDAEVKVNDAAKIEDMNKLTKTESDGTVNYSDLITYYAYMSQASIGSAYDSYVASFK